MEYQNFALDLGQRTLDILNQYEACVPAESESNYSVTLLINSLLALIVLPKEKGSSHLSPKQLNSLGDWGIKKSTFGLPGHKTVRDLIYQLRGGVAHVAIEFELDEQRQMEFIIIKDDDGKKVIASFYVPELKPFLENFYRVWSEALKGKSFKKN